MHLFVHVSKLFLQTIHQIVCIHLCKNTVDPPVSLTKLAPPCECITHKVADQKVGCILTPQSGRVKIQAHSEQEVLQFAMLPTEFWRLL